MKEKKKKKIAKIVFGSAIKTMHLKHLRKQLKKGEKVKIQYGKDIDTITNNRTRKNKNKNQNKKKSVRWNGKTRDNENNSSRISRIKTE